MADYSISAQRLSAVYNSLVTDSIGSVTVLYSSGAGYVVGEMTCCRLDSLSPVGAAVLCVLGDATVLRS